MDYVLTNAQYELLMCDAPFVSYKHEDTEGGEKKHTAKELQAESDSSEAQPELE